MRASGPVSGAVTSTVAVSALPAAEPITRNVPGVNPGAYTPSAVIAPPVAVQSGSKSTDEPSLMCAVAEKATAPPAETVTRDGVMVILVMLSVIRASAPAGIRWPTTAEEYPTAPRAMSTTSATVIAGSPAAG